MISQSIVQTPNASKYMKQLCNHFAHKLKVAVQEDTSSIEFPMGKCTLTVENDNLIVCCETDDVEGQERMQFAVEKHFKQFAWREEIEFVWAVPS